MVAHSAELVSLAKKALDHGIKMVRDTGNDLVPFAFIESDKGIDLVYFNSDRLEFSIQKGMEYIWHQKNDPNVKRYAIAFSGYITTKGAKDDAVIVYAGEKGSDAGYGIAQRFCRKSLVNFETIGDSITDIVIKNLLTNWEPQQSNKLQEPEFKKILSEYGFTINYPDMPLDEPAKGHQITSESGMIGGTYTNSVIYSHILLLSWSTPVKEWIPQSDLDEHFSNWTLSKVTRDPILSISINNLNISYQTFTAVFPKGTSNGACGVWFVAGRSFTLMVLGKTYPKIIFRLFNMYLSSFSNTKSA